MKKPIQYHSPIHLLLHLNGDIDEIDIVFTQVLKKQAILELQLSENQFLEINNFQYSKQSILDLFDKLDEDILAFHLHIWKHIELLTFLESFRITKQLSLTFFSKNYKIENTGNNQLDVYLVYAFIEASKQLLKQNKFIALTLALNYINQLDTQLRSEALRIIDRYYKKIDILLASTSNTNYLFKYKKHPYLSEKFFYLLLNKLPAEYQGLRDSIADNMVNHIYYYYRYDRRFYSDVSANSLKINCSISTKKLLVNNFNAIYRTPVKDYLIIFSILILLFSLIIIFELKGVQKSSAPIVSLKDYQKEISIVNLLHHKKDQKDSVSHFVFKDSRGLSTFVNDASLQKNIYVKNNTHYDAIFVFYDNELGFFQQHIPDNSLRKYKLNLNNSSYFLYLGENWNNNDSIYYSVVGKNNKTTRSASMNGFFSTIDNKTNQLLDTVFQITKTNKIKDSIYHINISLIDSSLIIDAHF